MFSFVAGLFFVVGLVLLFPFALGLLFSVWLSCCVVEFLSLFLRHYLVLFFCCLRVWMGVRGAAVACAAEGHVVREALSVLSLDICPPLWC